MAYAYLIVIHLVYTILNVIVFPSITVRVLNFYGTFRTKRLNETGVYFTTSAYFLSLNLNLQWTYNLSIIAAHPSGLWTLSPKDHWHWQQWPSIHFREHFLRSGGFVFLYLMLQKTIAWQMSTRSCLTNWSLDQRQQKTDCLTQILQLQCRYLRLLLN